MKFEWDEAKRARTLEEPGIDFADIETGDWSSAITIPDTRREYGEPRYITYLPIDGRVHLVVFTPRNGVRRVISMWKANERDVARYGKLIRQDRDGT